VNAPAEFTFSIVKDFNKMTQMSENIKEAVYDPEKKQLFLHMAALGFHSHMLMSVEIVTEGKKHLIKWKNLRGFMTGMQGQLKIAPFEEGVTEISIDAYYQGKELLLPRVLMGVGMEIVTEKMSQMIRSYVESQYKKP
jgi:uncharacterized membrane protein